MPDKSKTLVVLDGMAYAFRSFYAVPEMSNTQGLPTNAVFGFANALRRAEKAFKPTVAVVAYDSPGGSFRDEMLAEYKGHRDAPPENLVKQFPMIEELAGLMGWTLLKQARMEADDIMATLCKMGRKAGYEVVLMTSDKDMLQLVGDGVRVYRENPKGASLYGPAEVKERYGVGPDCIGDLLGLMGDSSDNIPGVPGIGEKTAAKLLLEYGNIEKVLKAGPKIKGKLGENLVAFAEQARLSRRLAALKDDVDLGVGLKELAYAGPDFAGLLPWLKRMELRTLVADYGARAASAGVQAPSAPAPAEAAKPAGKAGRKAKAAPPMAALKNATPSALAKAGLDPALPCGVAFAPEPTPGGPLPKRLVLAQAGGAVLLNPADWAGLRAALAALKQPVLFLAKPLQRALLEAGCEALPGILDLNVAGWLLNSTRQARDLAEAASLLGIEVDLPAAQAELFEADDADLRKQAEGLALLGKEVRKRLKAEDLAHLYDDLEGPLIAVLAAMERDGVKLDVAALDGLESEAQKEMATLQKQALKAAGRDFNLNSPSQLAEVLFTDLGLKPIKKTKTGYSTDSDVLEALADDHELPGLILEHRQLAKLSGTYLQALPKLVAADGRVHSTWNQTGTATGRISSLDPNLQNIPVRSEVGRRIRHAFVAAKRGDSILAADYSQIELRVLAHYCGDPVLKKAFQTGRDIHTETAARMFHVDSAKVTKEMRSRAKVINFGVLYGMGAFRISREFGVPLKEGKSFLDDYFGQFPTVRDFLERCKQDARDHGFASTLLKRRRPIPEINSANRVMREQGERVATNLPIQGTAADLMKLAMLAVDALLKKKKARTRILMQVHDELVFELAKEEADSLPPLIQKAMEQAMKLDVPVQVEMGQGRSWADAKA
jgi:DNA polymerase-1